MRTSTIERQTNETKVSVRIDLDGTGQSEIATGIGFFDHMLTLFAKHGRIDLVVRCEGDLEVDGHHTVEDVGIVLGKAIAEALGDKRGIGRYGSARIPMDEALAVADVDISGRPFLSYRVEIAPRRVGGFDTALAEEFFRALAHSASITLHLTCEYGKNGHHIIEGLFKAFARAMRDAATIDPRFYGDILSTKGVL